jgi:hypothetical protein
MIKIDKSIVEQVTWEQDPDTFDQRLHALGSSHDEFVVVNPKYEWILDYIDVDAVTSDNCIVWSVDNLWLVKKFKANWTYGWDFIRCELEIEKTVEFNPEVKYINAVLKNKILDYKINIEDANVEHVWYVDPKFNSVEDKVWIARCHASDAVISGSKDMGYLKPEFIYNPALPQVEYTINVDLPYHHHDFNYDLVWYLDDDSLEDRIWIAEFTPDQSLGFKDMGSITPDVVPTLEFNPDIPNIKFDLDINVSFLDLVYEHVWYLDPRFNPFEEDVWAVKLFTTDVRGVKSMGYVSPEIERNPAIPDVNFEFETTVPYYEFKNDLIWYLDPRFNPTDDNIWAIRILSLESEPGLKDMGTIGPKIILNPDLPKLDYYINDHIPYYDLGYEHVWMLDSNLHNDKEAIWAAKIVPNSTSLGVKEVGNIGVRFSDFDVVFISYNEPNAEANWYRVLEIFPDAKRVKNVKGIFEAHKRAAEIATTSMFYVVDGDAELVDNWKFNFKPEVFDMDCVHLWTSINPINDLEYGWGGVKLFPRQLLLDATTWQTDLTMGLGKLKYINKVSNVTAFNTDPFGTWRSAFRECAKLSSSLYQGTNTTAETEQRLQTWTSKGQDRQYGEYALHGAALGKQYGLDNFNSPQALQLINNYEWMRNEFDKFYKH